MDQDGQLIHLDVRALSKEVRGAVQKWFLWIENEASKTIADYVERHAKVLAQKAVIEEIPASESLSATLLSCTSSPRPT